MSPEDTAASIYIAPYDSRWPARFADERMAISEAITTWIEGGIEHVGSTAVPGLAAKPVIDIMAGVRNLVDSRAAFGPLAKLGYLYAPYRTEVMHWFCKPSEEHRTHHLHLVEYLSPRWKAVIGFRDYLRLHPETAREYEALKRALALRFSNDREAYTEAKSSFIDQIVSLTRPSFEAPAAGKGGSVSGPGLGP
ncbi:MAG: Glutamate-rich protein [Dehalococcoidia bacterium]|nr:Glutamate-rich protein [Dehalococcoidia bacterium]